MRDSGCLCLFYVVFLMVLVAIRAELAKSAVDRVIEDQLTHKLSEDLLQSIERKFQVDLERSVDMVLVKIKLLLQNGTMHIQDRLLNLQRQLATMKKGKANEVDKCLLAYQNVTTALAEKALHQMVVCGYALIGHDPAQAVKKILILKNMISTGIKPVHENQAELYDLLKICGHDHDSLKKVVKCVISKSPLIKSAMMDITSKLIEGVITLTKLMAHGAMHEACLIEVIKTTQDEAFQLVTKVRHCVYDNDTIAEEADKFVAENNATVLDAGDRTAKGKKKTDNDSEVNDMIRRVINQNNHEVISTSLKNKLMDLQKELGHSNNLVANDVDKENDVINANDRK